MPEPAPRDDAGPLALGYTLFKIDAGGQAVSVTPDTIFATGEKVRIRVEPSAEGYLYVFSTENDRSPVMIFPDARLDDGSNFIDAHAGLDVPSATRSFKITGDAEVDRLYVLLTREALPEVPTENELVKYCQDFASACPWKPSDTQWSTVMTWASDPAHLTTTKEERYAHRGADAALGNRSLVLSEDDPPPSVIGASSSKQAEFLVLKVDLKHK